MKLKRFKDINEELDKHSEEHILTDDVKNNISKN